MQPYKMYFGEEWYKYLKNASIVIANKYLIVNDSILFDSKEHTLTVTKETDEKYLIMLGAEAAKLKYNVS